MNLGRYLRLQGATTTELCRLASTLCQASPGQRRSLHSGYVSPPYPEAQIGLLTRHSRTLAIGKADAGKRT
jgi:hypothetical protein